MINDLTQVDEHPSETEMFNIIPDYEIGNNGSIDDLCTCVKMFLKEFKFISA